MQKLKFTVFILASALTVAPHAAQAETVFIKKDDCVLEAVSIPPRSPQALPRYHFQLEAPHNTEQWDFTFDDQPNYHTTSLEGPIKNAPDGAKDVPYKVTLHQFETYEETLTFKNLELAPLPAPGTNETGSPKRLNVISRFLNLEKPVTATTPSGFSITLPAQSPHTLWDLFTTFAGNADALFFKMEASPNQPLVSLPNSPLFKKYGKPVRVQLSCPQPNLMVFYQADNTYKTLAIDFPDRKTATHLDELTLIVLQRVELQTIPVTVKLPLPK